MNFIKAANFSLFTISMGKLEFKASLVPTLVTLVLLYLLISLGQWQLDRASEKESLEALVNARSQQTAIDIADAPATETDRMYLPVYTSGRFDTAHQILLDNQVVNHQAGYQVYTPLFRNNHKAVLVDRGWIPQGSTRQDIPDITLANESTAHLNGILLKPPSAAIVLADNVNDYSRWPAVMQYMDFEEIEQNLGYEIYPLAIKLNQNNPLALHQEPVRFNMTSDKHLGYAFQWFALAVTLSVIYFVVNTKREKTNDDC